MFSNVPPRAIDGNFTLDNLHWLEPGPWTSAHGTGRIGWAQPGSGGNGINRQAPVRVRATPSPLITAVLLPAGPSALPAPPTTPKARFADPCGNTAGCWVAPCMPVA